jgi:hypothetical protein
MDSQMNDFKVEGEMILRLPLSLRFEKILRDFLRLVFLKSGFSENDSVRCVEKFVESLRAKLGASENEAPVEIRLSHRPGNIILRTTMENASILEEQTFTTR